MRHALDLFFQNAQLGRIDQVIGRVHGHRVALVQAASTLPVFLLGLPSGALADIVDRRRYFMVTQFWVAANATLTCVVVLAGWMNPPLLLALERCYLSARALVAAPYASALAATSRANDSWPNGGGASRFVAVA